MASYTDDDGTTLEMGFPSPSPSESIQILVKNLDGLSITLNVTATDTVGDLKTELYNDDRVKKKLPNLVTDPSQLRIIFEGKQLEDDQKISDYNIQKNDTLHLLLSSKGGAVKKNNIKLKTSKTPKLKTVLQPTSVCMPTMQEAVTVMTAISQTQQVDAHSVLMSMSTTKLLELKEYMNNNQTHIDKKLDKLYEYTPQGEAIGKACSMMDESKDRLSYLVKQGMIEKYGTVGDMNDDIDKAIRFKMGGSSSSGSTPQTTPATQHPQTASAPSVATTLPPAVPSDADILAETLRLASLAAAPSEQGGAMMD